MKGKRTQKGAVVEDEEGAEARVEVEELKSNHSLTEEGKGKGILLDEKPK